ncbi:MAG: hypothetical protein RLZZ545_1137, partial [Actinomycetota bacterium]
LVQPGSDFAQAISLDIDIAAPSLKALAEISEASRKLGKKARVHLEVDTGMTRGGFLSEWSQIDGEHVQEIEIVGIFSHFARADEPGEPQNEEQLHRFTEMTETLRSFGFTNVIRHLSNSAATLKHSAAAFDMVRAGIAMYGLSPDVTTLGSSATLALRPAMQLRAALYLVKDVAAGIPVGYGATESTSRNTRLGVVTMGYAGVSMDQFVVDLGPDSKAQSGDWVVVFGNGSHGEYTADDWGAASGSINYEIVTRIGPRVPRIYSAHIY